MNARRMALRMALGAGLAALTGCAATPPARFYALAAAAVPGAAMPDADVVVGPVSIPAVVDRPEIVVSLAANEVWLDEFNRWAAPLADNIALATADNLHALLGATKVRLAAQTAGGAGGYRVAIEVQRFESEPGTAAVLDAVWTVRRVADGATTSGRTTLREPTNGAGYAALAAAHSRALAQLGRAIAQAVRQLAPAAANSAAEPVAATAPSRGR